MPRRLLLAAVLLLLASVSQAQVPSRSTRDDGLLERALVALNAFESWAFVHTADEADTVTRVQCEPASADAPHSCYPGTIPPCIGCRRYVATPLFDFAVMRDPLAMRSSFLAAETLVLATLDSAVRAWPANEMMVGTLVFLLSKRGKHADAAALVAGSRCGLSPAECALLRGYTSQAAGNSAAAALEFERALPLLSEAERCEILDASALLDEPDAQSYSFLKCPQRIVRDAVFWWLSDPSWLVPGNDRYAEHIARAVGNRILQKYRGSLLDVSGVSWYAGQIPRSDSVQWHHDYRAWVRHNPGPWRWTYELTRFGVPDAMDVDIGLRQAMRPVRSANTVNARRVSQERCGAVSGPACLRSVARMCEAGYEPREMYLLPRDTADAEFPARLVPEARDSYGRLYPPFAYSRYDWSDGNSNSCTRVYNTRARHQFTPSWGAAGEPFSMSVADLLVTGNGELPGGAPWREQYTPSYAPVTTVNNFQIARLPRGDSMLVVAVVEFDGDGLDIARAGSGGRQWEAALMATTTVPPAAGDMMVARSRSTNFSRRHELRGVVQRSSIMAGIELLTPDTVGFARARVGIPLSPWLEGSVRLSDLVLFKPDSMTGDEATTGARLESILPSALASLSVKQGEPLGLYWEIELPRNNESTQMTATLVVQGVEKPPGFLARLVRGVFSGGSSREIAWQIGVPRSAGNAAQPLGVSLAVPTSGLRRGEYLISVRLAGANGLTATTERRITLDR